MEVSMHVKDGGMKLVRILTPDFRWQSGNANIRLKLHGLAGQLGLDGGMQISKATVTSPFLKYPMTNMSANVGLADNIVQVRHPDSLFKRRLGVLSRFFQLFLRTSSDRVDLEDCSELKAYVLAVTPIRSSLHGGCTLIALTFWSAG